MIIFGRNIIEEALKKKLAIKEIRVAEGLQKGLENVLGLAAKRGVNIKIIKKYELNQWAETDSHQGIAANVEAPPEITLDELLNIIKPGEPIVLLDGVEDPRNFGAILRTSLAAGCGGVVVPKDRAAPLSSVAIKASAGAAFHLPLARVTNLARSIDELKKNNWWIFGAGVDADKSLYEIEWAEKTVIVLGGEGGGLRELTKKKCDILFRIPMDARVESLNVSVAAGIILFEHKRRK